MSINAQDPQYGTQVTPSQFKEDVLAHLRSLNGNERFLGNHFHGNRALYLRVGLKESPVLFAARQTRAELSAALGEQDFLEALTPIQAEYEEKHQQHHG